MNELVQLLIYLLIAGVVIWAIQLILNMLTLPPPVKTIILVVISLVFLLWILRLFGFFVL